MDLTRARNQMACGALLLGFVAALAVGTAGAPALGGLSWLMVVGGAAGVVYVISAGVASAAWELRHHPGRAHGLRPAVVPVARPLTGRAITGLPVTDLRGGRSRSTTR